MIPKANILLLRDPTASFGMLETVLTNITSDSGMAQDDLDGVIVTNACSFETWDKANGTRKDEFPFYVVGKAAPFRHAQRRHPWRISWNGRAARRFILAIQPRPTKLLHLTGDKNRDILPNILAAQEFIFTPSSSLASSVDNGGPIMPETHPVHIDIKVPDMEEGEGIGEVDVALVTVKAGEKPTQPAGLANSVGLQEKRVLFRQFVHKLVLPGNRPSTVLSFI
ncbi:hypothetical protein EDD85DRAFT_955867 [Armillaria nabsnona]|nr:hypothetical protein EDD85DRAFT_955867 [Armillaria nabsnona]